MKDWAQLLKEVPKGSVPCVARAQVQESDGTGTEDTEDTEVSAAQEADEELPAADVEEMLRSLRLGVKWLR